MEVELKSCKRCEDAWPLYYFDNDPKSKGGKRAICRFCRKKARAAHYAANRDSEIARNAAYRWNNYEKEGERHREYNQSEAGYLTRLVYRADQQQAASGMGMTVSVYREHML